MGHPHLTTDKFRSKFHSVFFCPIKPGAAKPAPTTKSRAPRSKVPIKAIGMRKAHIGVQNAKQRPYEKRDGRARLKPAPTHTKSRAPDQADATGAKAHMALNDSI